MQALIWGGVLMAALFVMAKRTNDELLDRGKWTSLTENLDYPTYEPAQATNFPEFSNWLNFASALKYVFYILVVALLLFLLYRLYTQMKQVDTTTPNQKIVFEHLDQAEAHLRNANLQPALQSAITSKNYRLALRILYLMSIAHLDATQAIKWKKQKTNRDYQQELKNHPFLESFQLLTANFERSWYGTETITQENFWELKTHFDHLQTTASQP